MRPLDGARRHTRAHLLVARLPPPTPYPTTTPEQTETRHPTKRGTKKRSREEAETVNASPPSLNGIQHLSLIATTLRKNTTDSVAPNMSPILLVQFQTTTTHVHPHGTHTFNLLTLITNTCLFRAAPLPLTSITLDSKKHATAAPHTHYRTQRLTIRPPKTYTRTHSPR